MTEFQPNHDAIRRHLFDRIHKSGEEVKNDLPNILRAGPYPVGLGLGQSRHALSYQNLLSLCESAPEVLQVLIENAPNGGPGGRPPKDDQKTGASTHQFIRHHANNSATVLSIRLAQDKPEFYENYLRGKYKSVTAAATAAGLLKDDANLRRVKSAFRKLTGPQRKEFLSWFRTELRKRKSK